MNVISIESTINMIMTLAEARMTASAYRALYKMHEREKTLTPKLKDEIITALILLDDRISALEEKYPELPQRTYDAIEMEKLNILQP